MTDGGDVTDGGGGLLMTDRARTLHRLEIISNILPHGTYDTIL